ncbi:MAG: hypothetical protein JWO62_2571 [Acidimicrobiaceae bacterium]|nr:hypothetical protein [Acidimicrobiaceae bacterium]
MTYIVLSDNFVGGPKGTVLADDQLGGCDVPALVEGGHLALQEAPPAAGMPTAPAAPAAPPPPATSSSTSSSPASGAPTEPATPAQ